MPKNQICTEYGFGTEWVRIAKKTKSVRSTDLVRNKYRVSTDRVQKRGDFMAGYTENIVIRMTVKEKNNLQKHSSENGMTMSEYVRKNVAAPPDITREEFEDLKMEILYELKKIGVNINQIAKKYNEYSYVEPREELLIMMERMEELMKDFMGEVKKRG